MSGLQHPLEANGGAAGRATHIRFTPSVAGGGGTGATGNGSTAGAPQMAPPPPVAFPPSAGPVNSSSGSYIRAGAPNIPPQPMSTSVPNVAEFNRNPLLCLLCNQAFQNPCLLACYHTFCAACLKGRVVEGKLACPLCGKLTPLRDGHSLPPSDHLLRFLVESTCEEFPKCANCDRNEKSPMFFCNTCVCWSSQRECEHLLTLINKETGMIIGDVTNLPMFYCNTCGQALCGQCRDETHRAKMFSRHEVIHMSKKTKDNAKKCSLHGEPYTMFCTTKKAMLCMKCFRDTSAEARRYCVDLDTAYNQGAKKLDRALTSIKELQTSLRDGVILFRALLEELRKNMEAERDGIMATYAKVIDALKKQYELLIKDLESQFTTKDGELKAQLHSVGTLLPTVQMHLILCTTFTSTANKHEFLTLAYQLIDRLTALAHLTYPMRPGHTSEIKTNYKSAYVGALEPIMAELTEVGDASSSSTVAVSSGGRANVKSPYGGVGTYPPHRSSSRANNHEAVGGAGESNASRFAAAGGATLSRLHMMQQQGPQAQEAIKRQTMSARGLSDKEFTKHCRGFDVQIKGLNNKFTSIKNQVSDLHRDVTTRRCLTSYKQVENIVMDCASLTDEIEQTDQLMRERKELFHKMWEEEQQRITIEQTIFKEQLTELCLLRDDLRSLMGIAQQLEPYIKSITSLMEQIQPEVGAVQPEIPTTESATTASAPPPANFHRQYNEQLPERIQNAVAVAEYKSRVESSRVTGSHDAKNVPKRMSPFDELMAQHAQQLQRERTLLRMNKTNNVSGQHAGGHTSHHHNTEQVRSKSAGGNHPVDDQIPPIPPPPVSSKIDDIVPHHLAEPPFEYSTPAMSDLPKKSLSENTAEIKKGLLSSILEKVKSKEEAESQISRNNKRLLTASAPLASSESLSVSDTSTKRMSATSSNLESTTSTVVKPFEPPGLGKPSRVTPVGLDEEPDQQSIDSVLESDSVEVLSVIRYNKSKLGSSTVSCSDKRSSSSETNSIFNNANLPCPACDAAAANRRVRSRSATRAADENPADKYDLTSLTSSEAITVATTASATSTTTGSLPSIIRRSSAPEIDESVNPDALSRISEVTTMASEAAMTSSTYSRSLERSSRPLRRPTQTSESCSDSEPSTALGRASVPSLDKKDLQRAVAHLQETLQQKIGSSTASSSGGRCSEVKAVVHRGPEANARTLDGQSIKQYESIKLNRHLGPYDTIKPSRMKRQNSEQKEVAAASTASSVASSSVASRPPLAPKPALEKRDSFEGHEEAVRTLVEAVQACKSKKSDG